MSFSVEFTPDLQERITALARPDESFSETVVRGINEWLDLHDGRTDRGARLAVLLDELGAAARGEAPMPQREQLAEWLELLNRVAG